jgi:tetratricopeptide (TPR) repeat protein
MKTVDKYLFQALDNYPYSLEETIESLDYALSYDGKNPIALCLYGRVHAEQLHDYEEAKRYFQEALATNIHAVSVYPFYLDTLILNEDDEEASKLIDFALTIKGIDKVAIMLKKVILLEKQNALKKALKLLKETKLLAISNHNSYEMDEIERRLLAKKELLAPKKKEKSKKEKSKKEKGEKGKKM